MKRIGGLWEHIVSFENLLLAYRKARRGKRGRVEVARFGCDLEVELLKLQSELKEGCYSPGNYRQFTIYERKPRVICAAPFRDRVVHHALMNVIEPPLDRGFIHDSYACRKGKGVHAAVDRYQAYAQRYPYVLKLDIRQYFPNIDHQLLKDMLQCHIKDKETLSLLDNIIDNSPEPTYPHFIFQGDDLFTPLERRRGIPIGNLTSQFFANLYLDDMDHWIKETLRVPAYLRYVDDLIILDDDKHRLWEDCLAIEHRLEGLRLSLHPSKRQISRTTDWVDVLGYLVRRDSRRLRSDNGHRFRRRLHGMAKAYAHYQIDLDTVDASVQSWIGHACHANTEGLRRTLFNEVYFQRERA